MQSVPDRLQRVLERMLRELGEIEAAPGCSEAVLEAAYWAVKAEEGSTLFEFAVLLAESGMKVDPSHILAALNENLHHALKCVAKIVVACMEVMVCEAQDHPL